MKHIYLMRHGQSTANAEKIYSGGGNDAELSEVGHAQANIAATTLAHYFQLDCIVTSPQQRAKQTAEHIAKGISYPIESIIEYDELRERCLGNVEGQHYNVAEQYSGNVQDIENRPGIEPVEQLYERAGNVLNYVKTLPQNNILLVCHNGIGRMLRCVNEGKQPLDIYKQPRLENAIIYKLQ